MAVGGITSSGSAARAQEASKAKAAEELSISSTSSQQRVDDLKLRGKQAATAGKNAAVGSLFEAAETGMSVYRKRKKVK